MKALIREHEDGKTEVMTEPFSPWVIANMAWLTGQEKDSEGNPLPGDGWTLVLDWKGEDAAEPEEEPAEAVPESPAETAEAVPETVEIPSETVRLSEEPKTILINGVEMTEEEVRRLLQS